MQSMHDMNILSVACSLPHPQLALAHPAAPEVARLGTCFIDGCRAEYMCL